MYVKNLLKNVFCMIKIILYQKQKNYIHMYIHIKIIGTEYYAELSSLSLILYLKNKESCLTVSETLPKLNINYSEIIKNNNKMAFKRRKMVIE